MSSYTDARNHQLDTCQDISQLTSTKKDTANKIDKCKYYLNKLDEPHRSQALSQLDVDFVNDAEMSHNISDAIYNFSNWRETKEGDGYWYELYENISQEQDRISYTVSKYEEEGVTMNQDVSNLVTSVSKAQEQGINKANKNDEGKPEWSLLLKDFNNELRQVLKVLELGKKKYTRKNWSQPMKDDEMFINGLARHYMDYINGEEKDRESGLHPLAHLIAGSLIQMWHDDNIDIESEVDSKLEER